MVLHRCKHIKRSLLLQISQLNSTFSPNAGAQSTYCRPVKIIRCVTTELQLQHQSAEGFNSDKCREKNHLDQLLKNIQFILFPANVINSTSDGLTRQTCHTEAGFLNLLHHKYIKKEKTSGGADKQF